MERNRDPREGFPGEPGEEGTETQGGRGGRGGQGGYGARSHDTALVIFILMVTIVLSVGTAIALKKISDNTEKIRQLERSDVRQLSASDAEFQNLLKQADQNVQKVEAATYRLCYREQIIRVAINLDRSRDEPRLPLYDCSPDLTGGVAIQYTPRQSQAFKAKVIRDHFMP